MNRRSFFHALAAGITALAVTTKLAYASIYEGVARTIYVSPKGKGKGTEDDPTNMQNAFAMAKAGDRVEAIYFAPGIYQ